MRQIKTYIIIIIIAFVGFIIGAFKIFDIIQPATFEKEESPQPNASEAVKKIVKGSIIFESSGINDIKNYSVEFNENTTVFDVLKLTASDNAIEIKTKQYDFGVFIESVGGLLNTKDKAWIYFVNGKSGNIAADKYILKNGDIVEWKYITPSE